MIIITVYIYIYIYVIGSEQHIQIMYNDKLQNSKLNKKELLNCYTVMISTKNFVFSSLKMQTTIIHTKNPDILLFYKRDNMFLYFSSSSIIFRLDQYINIYTYRSGKRQTQSVYNSNCQPRQNFDLLVLCRIKRMRIELAI